MKSETIKYKTPITYYGGKQNMIHDLIPMIPPHKIYCEPFFGGGALFFAKTPSFLEVINDKNDNLINFYYQCQMNFEKLAAEIDNLLYSESIYKRAKHIYNGTISADDLERAVATFVVFNMSNNGSAIAGWKFDNGTDGSHIGKIFLHDRRNFCPWLKKRMEAVQISCRDALTVIKQRDSCDTFFFIDPPYIGASQGHYSGYTPEDFTLLLQLLSTIHGQFLLTCYDNNMLQDYITKNHWHVQHKFYTRSLAYRYQSGLKKQETIVTNFSVLQTQELELFRF